LATVAVDTLHVDFGASQQQQLLLAVALRPHLRLSATSSAACRLLIWRHDSRRWNTPG